MTYIICTAMAGGNHFLNLSNFAIPCIAVTGMAKNIVRSDAATNTPILYSGKCLYGIAKFLHNTSLGSGAISVIHNSGFECCWDWAASAAPHRVLNVTKATGNSCKNDRTLNQLISENSNGDKSNG